MTKVDKITNEGLLKKVEEMVQELLVVSDLLNDHAHYEEIDYSTEAWSKINNLKDELRTIKYSLEVNKRVFTEEELQEEDDTVAD